MNGWTIAGIAALVVVATYAIWTDNRRFGLDERRDRAW